MRISLMTDRKFGPGFSYVFIHHKGIVNDTTTRIGIDQQTIHDAKPPSLSFPVSPL